MTTELDPAVRGLTEAVHRSGTQFVLAVTGGGTGAAAQLLAVPGASRTVLEVVVPYHAQAMTDFLGYQPEQYCSAATGAALARRAFDRARTLVPTQPVVGVGCTATLATDRPKRGDHRFYVAAHTERVRLTAALVLTKGARSRAAEEALLDMVLLNVLATAAGIAERVSVDLLPDEALVLDTTPADDMLSRFERGELPAVCFDLDGQVAQDGQSPKLLLSGSFNPVHVGHWQLAETAGQLLGVPAAFELCAANADKPPLPSEEIRRRATQFTWHAPLWVTRAATFVEKALRFPDCVFLVGADTAERILLPKYYPDAAAGLAGVFGTIRQQGGRFLVAGRRGVAGTFLTLADLAVPIEFADLFTAIPPEHFRIDCSSSELRQHG